MCDIDIKLLELVQQYSFIYDKSQTNFKDKDARKNAWNSIGICLARRGEHCEQRWNVLRTRYNTEMREIRNQLETEGCIKKKWYLFDAMQFLERHIVKRKTKDYVENIELTNESIKNEIVIEDSKDYTISNNTNTFENMLTPITSPTSSMAMENVSDLLNENVIKRKRPYESEEENSNRTTDNVNKFQFKITEEDADMCFAKQIYFYLKEVKHKRRKKEIQIKIMNLFLEAEDSN